ncbi:hypothetical protein WH47_07051 [Habropoda laboriosa]|uniref:Uncharacterized protein n=1 Tax=Habropoda laboriosa TaxID=597456 RepID=A0A0L7RGM5_9HYME|nr:hypothetical protein WH47_07051 [Habropoda laboriosa]
MVKCAFLRDCYGLRLLCPHTECNIGLGWWTGQNVHRMRGTPTSPIGLEPSTHVVTTPFSEGWKRFGGCEDSAYRNVGYTSSGKDISFGLNTIRLRIGFTLPQKRYKALYVKEKGILRKIANLTKTIPYLIHDQTTNWIYLATETLQSFVRKREGHFAKNCKLNENHPVPHDTRQTIALPTIQVAEIVSILSTTDNTACPKNLTPNETIATMDIDVLSASLKRTRSESQTEDQFHYVYQKIQQSYLQSTDIPLKIPPHLTMPLPLKNPKTSSSKKSHENPFKLPRIPRSEQQGPSGKLKLLLKARNKPRKRRINVQQWVEKKDLLSSPETPRGTEQETFDAARKASGIAEVLSVLMAEWCSCYHRVLLRLWTKKELMLRAVHSVLCMSVVNFPAEEVVRTVILDNGTDRYVLTLP